MAITRPYTPQEWENGDVITKEKLDNIEAGIAAVDAEITGARGSGSSAGTLGKRIDDLIMVQDTQPTSEANEIWIRSTGNGVQVPTYEEFETLTNNTVHINETQTLTDAQKATARDNIDSASVGEVSDLKNALDNLDSYTYSNLPIVIENAIDTTDVTEDGYWNHFNGGIFGNNNQYNACNKYIKIKGSNQYSSWKLNNHNVIISDKLQSICWYDANKQFISGTFNVSNEYIAPDNAYYVRISYPKNYSCMFIDGFTAPTEYTPFSIQTYLNSDVKTKYDELFDMENDVEELTNIVNSTIDSSHEYSLFDYSEYIISGYYIYQGNPGNLEENNSGLNYAKIPVISGETYKIKGQVAVNATLYGFLDSNGDVLSTYQGTRPPATSPETITTEVTIPNNVSYLAVSVGGSWVLSLVSTVYKSTENIIYTLKQNVEIPRLDSRVATLESQVLLSNILWGKKIATVGTSITFGAGISPDSETGIRMTYGAITAKRNNMTFVNYGVSGSTLQYIEGKSPFVDPSRYQNMDRDLDYLTIEFGWNDAAYGQLGAITDNVNTTYYGAWNIVLPWLIENYPTTKIGLIVPYGTSAEMREAVRLVAKKWGVGYMDLTGDPNIPLLYNRESSFNVDSSIQTLYRTRYLSDGVHPNQAGYNAWATAYEAFLRSL